MSMQSIDGTICSIMLSPKDKAIFLRISEEDKQLFQRAAERADMKLSEWIRKIAKDAARKSERVVSSAR